MSSVKLYIYDLSRGMAKLYAPMLLGQDLEGVWHSSLVVHNREIYYGQGIFCVPPGTTHLGAPHRVIDLGESELPLEVIEEYLEEVRPEWTADRYHLFLNNCNDFSDSLAEFLVGKGIPSYVKDVAKTVAGTPFGQMLLTQLTAGGSSGAEFGAV